MIENSQEIYERVKASLPGCRVLMIEGDQIATMSIHGQVLLLLLLLLLLLSAQKP